MNEEYAYEVDEKSRKAWLTVIIILVAVLAMIIGFAVGMGIGKNNCHHDIILDDESHTIDIPETTEPVTEEPTEEVTEAPTEAPTEEPTEIPTEETIDIPEATEEPTEEEVIHVVDPHELELVALVIYQEVGGREYCDDCRRYVADVMLNRVNDPRYPDTMEGVLTQKHQYGMLWQTGIKWPPRREWPGEKDALAKAYKIAEEVLMGQHSWIYGEGYIYQASFKQGDEGFWCCGMYYARGEW